MDITTLGIAVDSKQVDQGTASMDKMTSAAQRVEQATGKMGRNTSQAAKDATRETKEMKRALADAATQGVVIGEAISAGIRVAIRAVKALDDMITKVGDLQDLADMTGASSAGLSEMRVAADVAGVSIDRVANMMVMMTRQISAASDESRGAGKALAALGINIDDFRKMRGDEQFKMLAQRLNEVEESGGKTALILDIVGRGGAEAAKLFKAMGDELNTTTGYTEEQIAAMDDYADANSRARAQLSLTLEMVAVRMSPAFAAFREALIDTITALMGVGNESSELGNNNGALEFAHAVGVGLANIIDLATKTVLNLVALGKTIGAIAAAGAALVSGQGMNGVRAVMDALKEDIDDLKERAKFSTADAFEKRFQEIVKGEKRVTAATNSELSSRVEAYKRANDRVTAEDRAAKREALKAERELTREKEKEEKERMRFGRQQAIEAGEAVIKANEEYQKKLEAARKAQADSDSKFLEDAKDQVNAINDRAAAIEEEVANRGRLRSAIEEERLALLERDRADFEGSEQALTLLDQKIDAQKRLIAALKSEEVATAAEESAKKSQAAFDRAWEQVGQSLSDAIMQGGMSAKQMLERLFANMILRPTVMAGAAGLLGGSAAGAAAAGSNPLASAASGLLGTVGSYFGAGGFMGSIAAGAGWLTGATTFGGAMSAGASLIGTGTLGGVASGLGMLTGALGPVALGVYGLYKLFGGKKGGPKAEGSAGFGADSLIGRTGNDLDQNAAEAVRALNDTYKRLAATLGLTREVQFGVGMSMDPRGTAPSFIDIRGSDGGGRTRTDVGRSEEEFKAALADMSASVLIESIKASGIDGEVLAYFEHISQGLTNEAKLAALEQAAAVRTVRDAIADLTNFTTGLATSSMIATQNIIEFAGGIDNLAAGLAAYRQNFFNDFEQRDMALEAMAKQLNAPGSGWQGFTKELLATWDKGFFRQVVEGLNVTTELGQRQFASLMNVAGMFAQIQDAAERAGIAAQTAADAERARAEAEAERARQEREAERARRQAKYEEALNDLSEAYNRQKDILTRTRDAMRDVTRSFEDFNNSLKTDQNLTTLTPSERLTELKAQFEKTRIEMERDGFSQESVGRVQSAARALLQGGREFFGSGEAYQQLFDQVTGLMSAAGVEAGNRATIAEQQLTKLDQQVGYLHIISNTLMSVEQALARVTAARQDLFGFPHADGLARVPIDNYPALLHRDEAVLTAPQADFFRNAPNLVTEIVAVRKELEALRKENRQDAGNAIGATFEAMYQSAKTQSEAVLKAARQREYQSRNRPTLA